MSGLTTKHLIEQQIPSHIREASPLFTKFLQYYYEFNEQLNIAKAIQDVLDYNNCDVAEIDFVKSFFEELQILPHNIVADRRLVAKHIYDLYQSKGSEKAVKLLFQIVFGETVEVKYPSEQILRTSDGKWIRENIITLDRVSGSINDTTNRIIFTGTRGTFSFDIISIENLEDDVDRVTFTHSLPYYLDGVSTVRLYSNDELDYVGTIKQMVSGVVIENSGKFWQVGQVVILPGTVDTILQVKRVGAGGSIVTVDVVQFGYGQLDGIIYTISPFKYRPDGGYIEQYSEKISDISFSHTINIVEYMNGCAESILGLDSNQTYVLEGYVLPDHIAFSTILHSVALNDTSIVNNDHITIEQWLESRARFRIVTSSVATKPGYYKNQDGMLSVPEIRLQDNFYYQIFSYVIETGQRLKDYSGTLNKIHPAGFKYFSNLTKIVNVDVGVTVDRILSRENMLVTDYVNNVDSLYNQVTHYAETYSIVDDIDLSNTYDENDNISDYASDEDYDELIEYYGGVEHYSREDAVEKIIGSSIADTFQIIEFEGSGSYDANNYPPIYGVDDYDIANGTDDQYTQEDPALVITLNS